ncbi:hypothetical protein DFP72DRAFT_192654 [Ephemerocybe angulata]|uniref:Uncharacterized protein n=1 Tax=Ephemerocybe angulata TaxID=980116 RepID=A0A8H6I421_9AGAR|nr:hypothetical protein DFP72DRAFT_192654 [Tulosesus angulatus]
MDDPIAFFSYIACENTINDAPGMHERHRRLTANATPSKTRRLTTTNDDENPSRSRPARRKNVCQCRHDLDDVRMTDLCNMRAAIDDGDDDKGEWWWKVRECGDEQRGRYDAVKRARLGKYDISSLGEKAKGREGDTDLSSLCAVTSGALDGDDEGGMMRKEIDEGENGVKRREESEEVGRVC